MLHPRRTPVQMMTGPHWSTGNSSLRENPLERRTSKGMTWVLKCLGTSPMELDKLTSSWDLRITYEILLNLLIPLFKLRGIPGVKGRTNSQLQRWPRRLRSYPGVQEFASVPQLIETLQSADLWQISSVMRWWRDGDRVRGHCQTWPLFRGVSFGTFIEHLFSLHIFWKLFLTLLFWHLFEPIFCAACFVWQFFWTTRGFGSTPFSDKPNLPLLVHPIQFGYLTTFNQKR